MCDKQNVNEYNENMLKVIGFEWLYHILQNTNKDYFRTRDDKGVPPKVKERLQSAKEIALLVAGPSAEDFAEEDLDKYDLVVAGPTSAGVAFTVGRPPDVVLVVDSSIKHLRHLQNLYCNERTDTLFYCCATVHPEVISYLTSLGPNVVLYMPRISKDNRMSKLIDDYNRILKCLGLHFDYMINAQSTAGAEMLFLKAMRMENMKVHLWGFDFATIDGKERCNHYAVTHEGVIPIEGDSVPMEARKGEIVTNDMLIKHWEAAVIVLEILKRTLKGNEYIVDSKGIPIQPEKDGFEVLTNYYENGIIPKD